MTSETMQEKPEWVKTTPAELEKLVVELNQEGSTPAKIGLILRDKHGIPKAKLLGRRITEILKNAKQEIASELSALEKKQASLALHIQKHKHDYPAKRSLNKKLWTLNRLKK